MEQILYKRKRFYKIFNCLLSLTAFIGCFFIPDLHWICWSFISLIATTIWLVTILSEIKKDFDSGLMNFLIPWGLALVITTAIWYFPVNLLWCLMPIGIASYIGFMRITQSSDTSLVSTMIIVLIVAYCLIPIAFDKHPSKVSDVHISNNSSLNSTLN